MRVVFWSSYHQTGNTYNLAAISSMVALEYRLRVLIAHNQFEKSGLETCFINKDYLKNDLLNLSNVGMDALCKYIKFSKADKQAVSSYTTTLIKNKFELLVGTSITNKNLYYKDLLEVLDPFLALCKECYDITFIDLLTEINDMTQRIFENADLIVISLNQNVNLLDDIFVNHKDIFRKCVFTIGRYDRDSRYNVKSIQRKYGIKDHVGIIPYNIEFADACSGGAALNFFMRNIKADTDDVNFYFISETRKSAALILSALNIDISQKKIGD